MNTKYEMVANDIKKRKKADLSFLSEDMAKKVLKFHKSFPQYSETPLVELKNLADYLKIKDIFVKDESFRFGLNAFKVLGGSFSIGMYIAQRLNKSIEDLTFEELTSDETKEKLGDITFITATDGNHGRGIAWTAEQLRQKAIVYMPKGSAIERRDRIRAHGAECEILDLNYDDCVRYASKIAEEKGYVMVQDTSWEGYEDIPRWIMQGYMTMAYEAYNELNAKSIVPTHIFIQAGVGSLASAVTGFFSSAYKENKPIITIVEPDKAACLFQTAQYDDGKLHPVTGDMNTIMAGLACGEPVTVGWDVLHSNCEFFLKVPDNTAAHGMRVLGNPLRKDKRVISGESGAVTTGVVSQLMRLDDLKDIREKMNLNENSVVLLFSTEGDTYFEGYLNVVWNGAYPNE